MWSTHDFINLNVTCTQNTHVYWKTQEDGYFLHHKNER